MTDDDDEARRRRMQENITKALGKAGAKVKTEGGKILAFKRSDDSYGPDAANVLAGMEPVKPRVIRNAIRCRKCDNIIESKHVHDFKSCRCCAVFVDGGHSYQRIGGELADFANLSVYRDELQ